MELIKCLHTNCSILTSLALSNPDTSLIQTPPKSSRVLQYNTVCRVYVVYCMSLGVLYVIVYCMQACSDPVGVIVLERCRVERQRHDTRPFSFVLGLSLSSVSSSSSSPTPLYFIPNSPPSPSVFLSPPPPFPLSLLYSLSLSHSKLSIKQISAFENDDTRSYVLSAFSQTELETWIMAIKMSRYLINKERDLSLL